MSDIEPAVGRAKNYHLARPTYAAEVTAFLARNLLVESPVMADVGAGTGLSTMMFTDIAGRMIAIEPDPAMRAIAASTLEPEEVEVRAGSAERTGLADGSIDLIIAASCFEWFQPAPTRAEWRRVLRPGGQVLLLWNHRASIDVASRMWDRLWTRHLGPRLGPGPEDIELNLVSRFLHGAIHRFARIEHSGFDEARLRRFVWSSAHAPRLQRGYRRLAVEQDILGFINEHGVDGQVALPFQTVGYLGLLG